jgi:putative salt-induced outer membrane protein YdiY
MINHKFSKNSIAACVFAGALSLSSHTFAQDTETGLGSTFDGWSGTASLGATSSTGNAEASNINGSIRLAKSVNRWEHLVFGSVFKGTSSIVIEERDENGEVILGDDGRPQRTIVKGDNSDRLALGYQPKFYYTPKTYFFGILDWEQDEPANIDSATRQIVGVGHRFYSNASGFLTVEAGLGNKATDLVFGEDVNGGIGYLGLNFLNRVTENVTFNFDLRSDFGSDNTFVELGAGVAFKLSEKLALKVSHFSRSNSDLDSGDNPLSSNSDSVTTMNLVIDI